MSKNSANARYNLPGFNLITFNPPGRQYPVLSWLDPESGTMTMLAMFQSEMAFETFNLHMTRAMKKLGGFEETIHKPEEASNDDTPDA